MSLRQRTAAAVTAAAFAAATAVALAAAPEKIGGSGVGPVKLGATFTALRARHLIGPLGRGCELAGPNARSAKLSTPLKGSVDFTQSAPRKVADISVTGGATARGIGIGATIAQIKAKFPTAKVDHSTDEIFQTTFVTIPKNGGGKFQFGVSTKTRKTTIIGIPLIPVCE